MSSESDATPRASQPFVRRPAPVLSDPVAIGRNSSASGPFSLALGDNCSARDGAVHIGAQLHIRDGVEPDHVEAVAGVFDSDYMRLLYKDRKRHYDAETYARMREWINAYVGAEVVPE